MVVILAVLESLKAVSYLNVFVIFLQVDLSAAYKIISETYEEREKCGLKELELFSKPYMGTPLPKNSPYKELFARRYRL